MLFHIRLQRIRLDRLRLPAWPLHLRSLALRRCHRNISAQAKVLIHDLALTFHRDSSPQRLIQLILRRQRRAPHSMKIYRRVSDIIVPGCSEDPSFEIRPDFSQHSCRSLEIPTSESVFVSVLGMFCLSQVILFHLMTAALDGTARHTERNTALIQRGVTQSNPGQKA